MDQQQRREIENLCIQEQAPPCRSGCPVHVDGRTLLAQVAAGDFEAAAATYRKAVPFPAILSRICDEPCHDVCTRGEIGDPLQVRALELACVSFSSSTGASPRIAPAKGKRAAVIGAGLSGLTAAIDLARKGWGVVLFEAADRLGGHLWDLPADLLPRDVISADIHAALPASVDIRLNSPIDTEAALADLLAAFDAVCLCPGPRTDLPFEGLTHDAHGRISVDSLTCETGRAGLFAGGSALRPLDAYSPITAVSDGRRIATSADRYLQNVSLSAARQDEGAYPSRLYTSIAGIEAAYTVPAAAPSGAYTAEEAIAEAARCIQCECLECVKVCEYLDHYGDYPKQHVRTVYNNLSIVMGERIANTFINSCALCGLCAEVCPTNLDMGAVCHEARHIMVEQERMPPSTHDFALRDMAFSNGDKFALARNAPGTESSDYVFFPGCQLAGSHPEYVEDLYGYLRDTLEGDVGLLLGCCGAPADWAGRRDLFSETLEGFSQQHEAMGRPRVVLACSSCTQVIRKNLPDVETVSLWEVFEQHGLPEGATATAARTVSIHDPCTARYETATQDAVRNLIGGLGYEIEELALSREKTTCCSYGGLMWFADRDLAVDVIQRRIAEGPADYVTYCAICRDFFAGQGKPTLHILDLIYGRDSAGDAEQRGPGYSGRHENRARLKRKLLRTIWGELMTSGEETDGIRLIVSDDLRAVLENRLILDEDIRQVIAWAERTRARLIHKDSGDYLAHYRPAAVTYWVTYRPAGTAYEVVNAYSHRMEVAENTDDE